MLEQRDCNENVFRYFLTILILSKFCPFFEDEVYWRMFLLCWPDMQGSAKLTNLSVFLKNIPHSLAIPLQP